jgi:hypothetical protein
MDVPAGGHFAGLLLSEVPKHDDAVLAHSHDLLLEELEGGDARQRDLLGERDRVELCSRMCGAARVAR